MEVPVVSVVMPCYNAEVHLATSVGSVLGQTFCDWELVAVDDGSTDGTSEWFGRITDERVRLVRQENKGLPGARNTGIRHAKGCYMVFLDADDTLHPEFLESMVAALEAKPACGIAYCGWQNIGLSGGRGQPFIPPDYERDDKVETLLAGCRWPVHAALVRRDVALDVEGFDETQLAAEDFDFWLRTATRECLVRVPKVLAFYHHHDEGQMSLSRDRAKMARFHLRAQRKFLAANPAVGERLGRQAVRRLLYGKILKMGYECYWDRDLPAARAIFREVMRHGYGSLHDWKYMLLSLLPLKMLARLLAGRGNPGADQ